MLHTPGTAIYVRVLEGQADPYGYFLTAFFHVALSRLSAPPQCAAESAPVFFVFDEAGSIPIMGDLKQLGLIHHVRGQITIVDREGLERASCECYRIVRHAYTQTLGV